LAQVAAISAQGSGQEFWSDMGSTFAEMAALLTVWFFSNSDSVGIVAQPFCIAQFLSLPQFCGDRLLHDSLLLSMTELNSISNWSRGSLKPGNGG